MLKYFTLILTHGQRREQESLQEQEDSSDEEEDSQESEDQKNSFLYIETVELKPQIVKKQTFSYFTKIKKIINKNLNKLVKNTFNIKKRKPKSLKQTSLQQLTAKTTVLNSSQNLINHENAKFDKFKDKNLKHKKVKRKMSKIFIQKELNHPQKSTNKKHKQSKENAKKSLNSPPRSQKSLQSQQLQKESELVSQIDLNNSIYKSQFMKPSNMSTILNQLESNQKINKKSESISTKNLQNLEMEDQNCLVCFDNEPDAIFQNCGHGGICYTCAIDVWKNQEVCYLCRKEIDLVQRLGKSSKQKNYFQVISSTVRRDKRNLNNNNEIQ